MDKLVFLYDKLMTTEERKLVNLKMEFISYGLIKAKLYFFNDDKRKRLFAIPVKGVSTKLIYGGIFLLKNYEEWQWKLHAYYNSLQPFTGHSFQEDLFVPTDVKAIPIKFKSLRDIEMNKYEKLSEIECQIFAGNPVNKKVKHSVARGRYYRINNVDVKNFIKLIKETQRKTEEKL